MKSKEVISHLGAIFLTAISISSVHAQSSPRASYQNTSYGIEGSISEKFRYYLEQLRLSNHVDWSRIPSLIPVQKARVSSGYDYRVHPLFKDIRAHYGTDIAAPRGTPIRAAADGVVVGAKVTPSYGNAIDIDHGNGFITRYAHVSKVFVQQGQSVRRGQVIALVGSTGRATGPHLHYEIFKDGWSVNPQDYFIYDTSIELAINSTR